MFKKRIMIFCCSIAIGGMTGCSLSSTQWIEKNLSVYQPNVLQGNVITREQLEWLKPGLTRSEVQMLLGSSLLQSVFHAQQWDYVFYFQRPGEAVQQRKLKIYFENDRVARYEADPMLSEKEFVEAIARPIAVDALPRLEADAQALDIWAQRKAAVPAIEPLLAPGQPPQVYPPLQKEGVLQEGVLK